MQIFIDGLLYHKAKQKWSRIINTVSRMKKLICKQYYSSDVQKINLSLDYYS